MFVAVFVPIKTIQSTILFCKWPAVAQLLCNNTSCSGHDTTKNRLFAGEFAVCDPAVVD